jgi:hypothetical protein
MLGNGILISKYKKPSLNKAFANKHVPTGYESTPNNRGTVVNGVFYAVRADM